MTTKLHLFVGHPRSASLSHTLADSYQRGAEAQGAEVRRQNMSEMEFDPDLSDGYHRRKMLEPDLFDFRENVEWADHLVWVYPTWWGGMPGKMKGLIDRCFLPGWAFQYHDKGYGWDKLLQGKTADVITTADTPAWYSKWRYNNAGKNFVMKQVLGFCGVRVTSFSQFAPVKSASEKTLEDWKRRAHFYGAEGGRR